MNVPVNLETSLTREYSRLLSSYNMVVTNTSVTRPASNNVLDHVVCNEVLAENVINETIYNELSDHNWIASSFKLSCPIVKQTLQKEIVDNRKLNYMFAESLAGLSQRGTANEKLLFVMDKYNELRRQCSRTVTVSARVKPHCPWMTLDLWKLIQIKDGVLKQQRRNRSDQQLTELLAHVSKKLQHEKAKTKQNYYNNLLADGNQKSAWKVINDVLGNQQPRQQPKELIVNGTATKDMNVICQSFNDFFCNVGPNLAATLNSDRKVHKFGTLRSPAYSMFFRPTSVGETMAVINSLNTNKSPGYDNISAVFVKQHYSVFAPLLADVFNEIIETGVFPDCLKIARVIPIHKSGDTKDPSNYRPISCLSVLDKIIEKMIVCRIVEFTNRKELIYKHQYGFRQGMSTLTATCDLVDSIYKALDNREMIGALFFDLKKAFDTIDHSLLLDKLDAYGIRGVAKSIIKSYLDSRFQFVSIGEHRSLLGRVTTGVPQGSNLGPILFLLFINDIAKLSLAGNLRLFADDTSIFYNGLVCSAVQLEITRDLELLNDYFETNLLSMNLNKTKYMLIHSPWRPLPDHDPIIINNRIIAKVSEFQFLGLTLDSTMSWSAHIDQLKRKLSSLCGILRKTSSFLPISAMKKMYYSLIHSRLQYLIANWGLAKESYLRELQVIQNRCLKIVLRKPHLYPTPTG